MNKTLKDYFEKKPSENKSEKKTKPVYVDGIRLEDEEEISNWYKI